MQEALGVILRTAKRKLILKNHIAHIYVRNE